VRGLLLRGCALVIAVLVFALGVAIGIAAWMAK
jgi:hypothetical protein